MNNENEKIIKLLSGINEIKADGSAVLTGKGAIAAKAMSISREKFSSQLLRDITPEERFVLINVLEKMLKNT